jgi:hypothetical protein
VSFDILFSPRFKGSYQIPVGGEIFRTLPNRPWGPPSHTVGTGSFPEVKQPGRGVVAAKPPSSAEIKERVEVYLYSSFGPSCPVLGRTLPLLYLHKCSVDSFFCSTIINCGIARRHTGRPNFRPKLNHDPSAVSLHC